MEVMIVGDNDFGRLVDLDNHIPHEITSKRNELPLEYRTIIDYVIVAGLGGDGYWTAKSIIGTGNVRKVYLFDPGRFAIANQTRNDFPDSMLGRNKAIGTGMLLKWGEPWKTKVTAIGRKITSEDILDIKKGIAGPGIFFDCTDSLKAQREFRKTIDSMNLIYVGGGYNGTDQIDITGHTGEIFSTSEDAVEHGYPTVPAWNLSAQLLGTLKAYFGYNKYITALHRGRRLQINLTFDGKSIKL